MYTTSHIYTNLPRNCLNLSIYCFVVIVVYDNDVDGDDDDDDNDSLLLGRCHFG